MMDFVKNITAVTIDNVGFHVKLAYFDILALVVLLLISVLRYYATKRPVFALWSFLTFLVVVYFTFLFAVSIHSLKLYLFSKDNIYKRWRQDKTNRKIYRQMNLIVGIHGTMMGVSMIMFFMGFAIYKKVVVVAPPAKTGMGGAVAAW